MFLKWSFEMVVEDCCEWNSRSLILSYKLKISFILISFFRTKLKRKKPTKMSSISHSYVVVWVQVVCKELSPCKCPSDRQMSLRTCNICSRDWFRKGQNELQYRATKFLKRVNGVEVRKTHPDVCNLEMTKGREYGIHRVPHLSLLFPLNPKSMDWIRMPLPTTQFVVNVVFASNIIVKSID